MFFFSLSLFLNIPVEVVTGRSVNECMSEGMNEGTNEGTNERTNERTDGRTREGGWVSPKIKFTCTHLYTRVERGTVRVSVLPKNTTQCPGQA